jgi:hypothetical protein
MWRKDPMIGLQMAKEYVRPSRSLYKRVKGIDPKNQVEEHSCMNWSREFPHPHPHAIEGQMQHQ